MHNYIYHIICYTECQIDGDYQSISAAPFFTGIMTLLIKEVLAEDTLHVHIFR